MYLWFDNSVRNVPIFSSYFNNIARQKPHEPRNWICLEHDRNIYPKLTFKQSGVAFTQFLELGLTLMFHYIEHEFVERKQFNDAFLGNLVLYNPRLDGRSNAAVVDDYDVFVKIIDDQKVLVQKFGVQFLVNVHNYINIVLVRLCANYRVRLTTVDRVSSIHDQHFHQSCPEIHSLLFTIFKTGFFRIYCLQSYTCPTRAVLLALPKPSKTR
jgi:hypothetical protein